MSAQILGNDTYIPDATLIPAPVNITTDLHSGERMNLPSVARSLIFMIGVIT